jgi:hypothetical protein
VQRWEKKKSLSLAFAQDDGRLFSFPEVSSCSAIPDFGAHVQLEDAPARELFSAPF